MINFKFVRFIINNKDNDRKSLYNIIFKWLLINKIFKVAKSWDVAWNISPNLDLELNRSWQNVPFIKRSRLARGNQDPGFLGWPATGPSSLFKSSGDKVSSTIGEAVRVPWVLQYVSVWEFSRLSIINQFMIF